jgi:MoaA/NifB/PqqE/SkfB family radical SAM enzyme
VHAGPAGPLVVVWRVTEACDLGCWFCEYNRHRRRRRHSIRAEDALVFGRVLADYATATGRPVLVSWLGGEPLVWPPLLEVGHRFRDDYGLLLGITTNGWQLSSRALIEHLAQNYSEVTISVDGMARFHETARGAPGLWERLRGAVGELRDPRYRQGRPGGGPLLRANTILMRSNLCDFEALCEAVAGWGIEEVTFNALGGQPPGPYFERERLRPADIDWLMSALPGIRERQAGRGLRLRGDARYLRRLASGAAGEMVPVIDCHPGAEFLFVDEDGRVAPCSFTSAEYGLPMAEIRTGLELSLLPARFTERRRQQFLPPCRDCPSTQVFGKFDLAEGA